MQSINIRANNNYLNYPTFASMRDYGTQETRKLIVNSDVIVFHTAIRPFYQALNLRPEELKDKKKLLYFHGSDCRNFADDICTQADEYLGVGQYEVLVSTPDLKTFVPAAHWMPVARDFKEIRRRYMLNPKDKRALKSFGLKSRLILCHAPTSPKLKGSQIFYKAITDAVQTLPNVEFRPLRNLPWDSCLREMALADVYYDQCILGAYGLAAVEAAAFKIPVVCLIGQEVAEEMEKESGLSQPFIQFENEDALRTQTFMMCDGNMGERLRRELGQRAYDYCKRMHDVKPVCKRFMDVVKAM